LTGFLEIDFVVHGGGSMAGEYLHSLVATDVCSGWIEAVPLLAREQALAVAGLMRIRQQMPVTTLGIDSENDGRSPTRRSRLSPPSNCGSGSA
jgi:hypothetical protein